MVLKSFQEKVEKKLGLPALGDVGEMIKHFPNEKQIKQIKDILEVADKITDKVPDLEKMIQLAREIDAISPEKWRLMRALLTQIFSGKNTAQGADLDKAIQLLQVLNSVPPESYAAIQKILVEVNRLVEKAPNEIQQVITALTKE